MAGKILNDGQAHFASVLFKNTAVQNYYLALLTDSELNIDDQIGAGLTEVSGTDYARLTLTRNSDWTLVGAVLTGEQETFTVGAGGWENVRGYAICLSDTPTTGDAIAAEIFGVADQGNKAAGNTVKVIPVIEFKDDSE